MTPEKKALLTYFAPSLKQLGFKKRGASWYRHQQDAVQVINIQQSQFSIIFFINLGVCLAQWGCKDQPLEYECHIRARLDHFVDPLLIQALLDFHKRGFNSSDAEEALRLLLENGIPWLQKCSTEGGFAEEARRGCFMLHHSIKGRFVGKREHR